MTKESAKLELVRLIHQKLKFHSDCEHGTYRGFLNRGEPYSLCETIASSLIAEGYGKTEIGPVIEWGIRWPLGDDTGKFVTHHEASRKAAVDFIKEDREFNESDEPRGTLVWRTAPGRWRDEATLEFHEIQRAQLKEATEALREFDENPSGNISTSENSQRLADALRAILGKD